MEQDRKARNRHIPHPALQIALCIVPLVVIFQSAMYLCGAIAGSTGQVWWLRIGGPVPIFFWIALAMCLSIVNKRRVSRGEPVIFLGVPGFYGGLKHDWTVLDDARAEIAWVKAHRFPANGHLVRAIQCKRCPTTLIDVADDAGNMYVIYPGVHETPWIHWIGGIFYVSTHQRVPVEKTTRRLAFFWRAECRWVEVTQQESSSWIALPPHVARTTWGWRCRDCGARRLDTLDTVGNDLLIYYVDPNAASDGQLDAFRLFGVYAVGGASPLLPSKRIQREQPRAA